MGSITVVMPVRNLEDTVEAAVRSVLQAPEVSEMLIFENGSSDATAQVLAGIDDPRITIFSKMEGLEYPNTMSFMFDRAKAPYVALCDGDDFYAAGRLAKQLEFLEANPDYAGISSSYQSMDDQEKPVAMLAHEGVAREVTDILLGGETVSHICTFLMRNDALRRTEYFRDWFQNAFDLDQQYRLAEQGRIWHDPTIMGYHYRLHDRSLTHSIANTKRVFFDAVAADFARQRRDRDSGQDDLMLGTPPTPPTASGEMPKAAAIQIAEQLEGYAWRSFAQGARTEALAQMWRSVRLQPSQISRWRGLLSMMVKSALPQRQT